MANRAISELEQNGSVEGHEINFRDIQRRLKNLKDRFGRNNCRGRLPSDLNEAIKMKTPSRITPIQRSWYTPVLILGAIIGGALVAPALGGGIIVWGAGRWVYATL